MRSILFPLFIALPIFLFAQQEEAGQAEQATVEIDLARGAELFRNQCATCHNRDMRSDLTGPALGLAEQQWAEYPREELYAWIRNSQAMIAAGHPRAVEMWNTWKPTVMTSNMGISDSDIESILAYINAQYNKADVASGPVTGAPSPTDSGADEYLYWILLVLLAVVAFVLARIVTNLNRMVAIREGREVPPARGLIQILTNKNMVGFVLFALIIFGGYTTVSNGIDFGRQQGYAPDQPIKYSHALHAGLHAIDCQYCHDGARRSKHAVIPAANTCMNCHRAIKKGSQYGTGEIIKIFASIGYDPSTDSYVEGYKDYTEEEIEILYKKWITEQYLADNGVTVLDNRGEREVNAQWEEIRSSLTNKQKKKIQGPIEWVRIHHLPDHVYFNHQQHVEVAEITCQECHGRVEEMEVVEQYSPLSMGWCVNCHRETQVNFSGNTYYDSTYVKYHEELQAGTRQGVTVEDIGGIECQKCHY